MSEKLSFDKAKTKFFSDIAVASFPVMRLHRAQRLWDRGSNRQRLWGNVSEHCLVEAARVAVIADLLQLPSDLKDDLSMAAAVHDFYKKAEVEKLKANGTSWEAYAQAQAEAKAILDMSPFGDRVKYLATAVGHETLTQAEELLNQPELELDDIAWLIMHYVDDYTINTEWATPAAMDKDGTFKNDLRRRMDRNREKAQPGGQYYGIHLAGVEHLGEPTYDAQERVGVLVETRLAQLVAGVSGQKVAPPLLPEFIDTQIAGQIEQLRSSGTPI